MTSLKDLFSSIAKQEGKKHQASVGDVREIVGLVSEAMALDSEVVAALIKNGQKRLKWKSAK